MIIIKSVSPPYDTHIFACIRVNVFQMELSVYHHELENRHLKNQLYSIRALRGVCFIYTILPHTCTRIAVGIGSLTLRPPKMERWEAMVLTLQYHSDAKHNTHLQSHATAIVSVCKCVHLHMWMHSCLLTNMMNMASTHKCVDLSPRSPNLHIIPIPSHGSYSC